MTTAYTKTAKTKPAAGLTLAQKIIKAHLISGDMTPGSDVALKIDQTLTQDATGTMAYLEFETMGIPRVKTEFSIAFLIRAICSI